MDIAFLVRLINRCGALQERKELSVQAWNEILFAVHDYFKVCGLREQYDPVTQQYGVVPFDYAKDE